MNNNKYCNDDIGYIYLNEYTICTIYIDRTGFELQSNELSTGLGNQLPPSIPINNVFQLHDHFVHSVYYQEYSYDDFAL